MSKKVVIVLVEGVTEETLLYERLNELYKKYHIKFEIQGGDIFVTKDKRRTIKLSIGNVIKSVVKKRKYTEKDILAIIHIMDTDGCFINDDCVEVNSEQKEKVIYRDSKIDVYSDKQKENIVKRNNIKSLNVKSMNKQTTIMKGKYNYQVYYLSRNLEHVIFDNPNPDNEGKDKNISDFINSLDIPIEQFLETFLPETKNKEYRDKYLDSWEFIEEDSNSLKKYTNLPYLFEYLDKELKNK